MCEFCDFNNMAMNNSAFDIELCGCTGIDREILFNNNSGEIADKYIIDKEVSLLPRNSKMFDHVDYEDKFSIADAWLAMNENEEGDGGYFDLQLSTFSPAGHMYGNISMKINYCPMCGRRLGKGD